MSAADQPWEARVAALWQQVESLDPLELVARIDTLAAEQEDGDAAALFERACARDTAGLEAEAEHYYRAALATGGLDAYRRSRACIQLASTLRILGQLDESERLLVEELDRHMEPGNERALHDEARATLALTYVAQGRAVEAAGLALCTLAPHLSRYNLSMSRNAARLVAKRWSPGEPSMTSPAVPTLYDWLGGIEPLRRLTKRFYERVPSDPLLQPIFKHMGADHPEHVAAFLAEVLGGPAEYSAKHGGHAEMVRHHLNRHLTNEQRKAWLSLLLDTADELQLPDDPEFRSALIGYLEWGTRLAVLNSQPGATVDESAPMPQWGWGEVKGPYVPG